MARILRLLIDPSVSPLRTVPPGERDLMITANNGWVLCFDNLSGIPRWFSDALCRLSSGGGFALRELYTNADEVIFDAQRPIILNGIDDLAVRYDLIDRSIVLNLPPIPETMRRPEGELWTAFLSARARILGALYQAIGAALANEQTVMLQTAPRMADFAKWVTSAAPALGWPAGAFLRVYARNRREAIELGLEASPVARPVRTIVDRQGEWTGTTGELLNDLRQYAGETEQRSRAWPQTAQALKSQLLRLQPALRMIGIEIESHREPKTGRRLITLRRAHPIVVTPVTPAGLPRVTGDEGDRGDEESVLHSCEG